MRSVRNRGNTGSGATIGLISMVSLIAMLTFGSGASATEHYVGSGRKQIGANLARQVSVAGVGSEAGGRGVRDLGGGYQASRLAGRLVDLERRRQVRAVAW